MSRREHRVAEDAKGRVAEGAPCRDENTRNARGRGLSAHLAHERVHRALGEPDAGESVRRAAADVRAGDARRRRHGDAAGRNPLELLDDVAQQERLAHARGAGEEDVLPAAQHTGAAAACCSQLSRDGSIESFGANGGGGGGGGGACLSCFAEWLGGGSVARLKLPACCDADAEAAGGAPPPPATSVRMASPMSPIFLVPRPLIAPSALFVRDRAATMASKTELRKTQNAG